MLTIKPQQWLQQRDRKKFNKTIKIMTLSTILLWLPACRNVLVKMNLTGLACDCLGSPGATKTAECSPVLPTAHAAAANQQCPTPKLGCCATGNNEIMWKQALQKQRQTPDKSFSHQRLHFLLSRPRWQPVVSLLQQATASPRQQLL